MLKVRRLPPGPKVSRVRPQNPCRRLHHSSASGLRLSARSSVASRGEAGTVFCPKTRNCRARLSFAPFCKWHEGCEPSPATSPCYIQYLPLHRHPLAQDPRCRVPAASSQVSKPRPSAARCIVYNRDLVSREAASLSHYLLNPTLALG